MTPRLIGIKRGFFGNPQIPNGTSLNSAIIRNYFQRLKSDTRWNIQKYKHYGREMKKQIFIQMKGGSVAKWD